MAATDIWPRLAEREALLRCRNLKDEDKSAVMFRVPVEHRPLRGHFQEANAEMERLPRGKSMDALRAVLEETGGLGLFAPSRWRIGALSGNGQFDRDALRAQAAHGSIIVWPPSEWARLRSEFSDWHYDGGVESQFKAMGLDYTFEDIVIFASINFSPGCWYLVVRGSQAGKVFWWTHDGDSQLDSAWAEGIVAWGERIWREVPSLFGGVIRFDDTASIDTAPPGAELYPETLVVA